MAKFNKSAFDDYDDSVLFGHTPAHKSPTIVNSHNFGKFTLNTYDDYTYGFVTITGEHKEGYLSAGSAKLAAQKLTAKTPDIVKSEDRGGYVLNTFSNGTYGYQMPDGTFKGGYKTANGADKAGKKLAEAALELARQEQEIIDALTKDYASKIANLYGQAVEEMSAKVAAFAEKHPDLMGSMKGKQWKGVLDDLTDTLVNADKYASQMANGMLPGVYAQAFNYGTYQVEKSGRVDTMFSLYDKATVDELIKGEPDLLPKSKVDIAKDEAWNRRHLNSALAQSILQGESVKDMAGRLRQVATMDANAAMRNARTMVTSVQNLGRVGAYKRAEAMGIGVKKEWMAALDPRTRGSHRHLDGEVVGIDDEFSNGLKYPGDPEGPGREVYNCRCTLIPVVDGIDYEDVERASKLGDMSYDEWKAGHINSRGEQVLDLSTRKAQIASARQAIQNELTSLTDPSRRDDLIAANNEMMLREASIDQQLRADGVVDGDMYSDSRKRNAWRDMDESEWDALLRGTTGEIWKAATKEERNAAYTYTTDNYGKFNMPLNGLTKWYDYVGPKKIKLNDQRYESKIHALTDLIGRSSYDHDMFVTRGGSTDELKNVFGLTNKDLNAIIKSGDGDDYVGRSGRMMSFVSTSPIESEYYVASEVRMNIFVPAGSEMIYAEPFSMHNRADYNGRRWDGDKTTSEFGGEFETILQRGGSYTLTGMRYDKSSKRFYVDIELHPEAGYDKFTETE